MQTCLNKKENVVAKGKKIMLDHINDNMSTNKSIHMINNDNQEIILSNNNNFKLRFELTMITKASSLAISQLKCR